MKSTSNNTVLIGGGGGVYRIASTLKYYVSGITTIQTMFDRGRHSEILRDERGMLPPGDIGQAILALADDDIEDPLRSVFSHRFTEMGSRIDGATIRNLMITALTEHYGGNIIKAIDALCKLFRVKGKVLPISIDHADLCVKLSDQTIICGEGHIDTRSFTDDRRIVKAFLRPKAYIYSGARDAIVSADKIVFCPGDLFTSIIPNTLVNGFTGAISESKAKLIFVVNLMTKKAETPSFNVSDFARTLLKYVGRDRFDVMIVNNFPILPEFLARYAQEQSSPVVLDKNASKYAKRIITGNFVQQDKVLRHSSAVARAILEA